MTSENLSDLDDLSGLDSESELPHLSETINYYNKELQSICEKRAFDPSDPFAFAPQQDEQISAYIAFVEDKHPYIIFDPFELRFKLYKDRRRGKLYYAQQNQLFNEAKSDSQKLCALAQSWYPNAEVSVECSVEIRIAQYLEQHSLIDNKITYSQQQDLLVFLNDLIQESRKTLRPALKPYGYIFTPDNNHKSCSGTIQPNPE